MKGGPRGLSISAHSVTMLQLTRMNQVGGLCGGQFEVALHSQQQLGAYSFNVLLGTNILLAQVTSRTGSSLLLPLLWGMLGSLVAEALRCTT